MWCGVVESCAIPIPTCQIVEPSCETRVTGNTHPTDGVVDLSCLKEWG